MAAVVPSWAHALRALTGSYCVLSHVSITEGWKGYCLLPPIPVVVLAVPVALVTQIFFSFLNGVL